MAGDADADAWKGTDAWVIDDRKSPYFQEQLGGVFRSLTYVNSVRPTDEQVLAANASGEVAQRYCTWDWCEGRYIVSNALWPKMSIKHELGCLKAHRRIWAEALEGRGWGSHWTAVFETDAVFRPDFAERLARLAPVLERRRPDLVYIGHCFEDYCPSLLAGAATPNLGNGVRVVPSGIALCSHGYLASRRAMEVLQRNTMPMQEAVDNAMRTEFTQGTLTAVNLCPAIVAQRQWTRDHFSRSQGMAEYRQSTAAFKLCEAFLFRQLPGAYKDPFVTLWLVLLQRFLLAITVLDTIWHLCDLARRRSRVSVAESVAALLLAADLAMPGPAGPLWQLLVRSNLGALALKSISYRERFRVLSVSVGGGGTNGPVVKGAVVGKIAPAE